MPVIVVANPKGGVGKSTVSTQVAGYLASRGHKVMLGDVDRQRSAQTWLQLRPAGVAAIHAWEVDRDDIVRPPKGMTHVVLDTPAGLHGKRLDAVMKLADCVLIPLQPSLFDIYATGDFVREIQARRKHRGVQLAALANRVRAGSLSAEQLRAYLTTLELPVLAELRDTQNYIQLAARGLTLWDIAPHRVEKDLQQWSALTAWLDAAG